MKPKAYIRYFILVLAVVTSMILFSYSRNSRSNTAIKESCPDADKCDQKQSEFVIWESLSRSLFSNEE